MGDTVITTGTIIRWGNSPSIPQGNTESIYEDPLSPFSSTASARLDPDSGVRHEDVIITYGQRHSDPGSSGHGYNTTGIAPNCDYYKWGFGGRGALSGDPKSG